MIIRASFIFLKCRTWLIYCSGMSSERYWGPFLERPRNFSGLKGNFEIKTCYLVAQFLVHKPVNFALFTNSCIVLFSKLWKLWSWTQTQQTQNNFPGPKSYRGAFEKQAPGQETLILWATLGIDKESGSHYWAPDNTGECWYNNPFIMFTSHVKIQYFWSQFKLQ